MRVVVTGATGNVGTSLVRLLQDDERVTEVIGIARRRPHAPDGPTRFVAADVVADDLAPHLDGADAVVHLAWLFQPTHRPTVTWETNVGGTLRLLDAVATAGVPALVHASSIGVYSKGPADGRPVDETWPTHSLPTAAYGREKAYVERLLDVFERDHPRTRVSRLRPAFIFKPTSATSQRRLFIGPFLPNPLVDPARIPVLPYPRGLRMQALHTDDVAEAYRLAVVGNVRGAFNVAPDDVLGGPELAELLDARPVAVPVRVVRAALAAGWHAHAVPAEPHLFDLFMQLPTLDTGRARAELGWRPRHGSRDAIGALLDGLRAGAGEPTAPLAEDTVGGRVRELAGGVGERQ